MRIQNISGNEAGEACAAFVENSLISKYKNYVYIDEYEESLNEDEISNGLTGFYTVVTVKNCDTEELFKGHVRCCDGFDSICTTVSYNKI